MLNHGMELCTENIYNFSQEQNKILTQCLLIYLFSILELTALNCTVAHISSFMGK
jgi:hypothetical protein